MERAPFVPAPGWVLPFAVLLLGIAVLPLGAPRFWESNRRKLAVSALLGLPVLGLYLSHHPQALQRPKVRICRQRRSLTWN